MGCLNWCPRHETAARASVVASLHVKTAITLYPAHNPSGIKASAARGLLRCSAALHANRALLLSVDCCLLGRAVDADGYSDKNSGIYLHWDSPFPPESHSTGLSF